MPALDHRMNHKSWNYGAIGIAGNHFSINDFFRHHDHSFRGAKAFDHHPEITPAVSVAVTVRALQMNNRDVRRKRPNRMQFLPT